MQLFACREVSGPQTPFLREMELTVIYLTKLMKGKRPKVKDLWDTEH